jgi:Na+/H+ antiporter NhaB
MSERYRQWLLRGATLTVVLLVALSLHVERLGGFGVFIVCFVAGSVGGVAAISGNHRLGSFWNRRSTKQKVAIVCATVAIVLLACFAPNYGKPDAASRNLDDCSLICVALVLLGCYHIFSRFMDRLWARFSRR